MDSTDLDGPRAKIEQMEQTIRKGSHHEAMALVGSLPSSIDTFEDLQSETWSLFELALQEGMPEIALAMLQEDKVHNFDIVNAVDMIGELDCPKAVPVFAEVAKASGLLRSAYHARSEHGHGKSQVDPLAIATAASMNSKAWRSALDDGLYRRWDRRDKTRYEASCELLNIPLWSSCAASSVAELARKEVDRQNMGGEGLFIEDMWHRGSALDLPEDFLLWSKEAVAAFMSESANQAHNPSWKPELLDQVAQGWSAACDLLPQVCQEMPKSRQSGPTAMLALLAESLDLERAAPWMPFMAAWGEHVGFHDADHAALAPWLARARIDQRNVGLVAANIHYGSFNARICRIATHLRNIGNMDDDSTLVIRARIEDLWENPVMKGYMSNSSFVDDFVAARACFNAEADRVELLKQTPSGKVERRPGL